MRREDRRAAIAACKERKGAAGIFAVRCIGSGRIWVGQSRSLETAQNRLWFALRLGTSPYPALQAAWRSFGVDGLAFEILERLSGDEPAYAEAKILRERLRHWQMQLGAADVTDPPPSAESAPRGGYRPT